MPAHPPKYSNMLKEEIVRLRNEEHKTPSVISRLLDIPVKAVHSILYERNPYLPTKAYRDSGESRWDFSEMNIEVRD